MNQKLINVVLAWAIILVWGFLRGWQFSTPGYIALVVAGAVTVYLIYTEIKKKA